ncbi:MvdC/MvdD family ATP grasp protein [Glycomyces xiaoerkulensis]|uniref:MvdC/MvdD family ATP grasp protein n=1 Tax=Glycomyces xiaoerkulensis TaxID=2038139 RepID=UPI0012FFE494|nr:hypothetical protein [Glycomyces xiaoerkulensis]
MILILSSPDDASARLVAERLDEFGQAPTILDPGAFPLHAGLSATITGREGWRTEFGGIDLGQVASVYYRRPSVFEMPEGLSSADRDFAIGEARRALGGLLAALPAQRWVNRPEHNAVAEYKPRQLHLAASVGLRVPATYIGNDPAQATEFAQLHGPHLIAKTFQPTLFSEHGVPRTTWTTRITVNQFADEGFTVTANLVQQWIKKAYEVRVTVVGDEAFAVRIDAHSEAARIDFRSDYDALTYKRIDPPKAVLRRLRAFMARMGLLFATFDFAVTPEAEWVFFECNPNGQWQWLELETGAPISAAITRLLISEA